MSVRGTVLIDLRDAKRNNMYRRVASLPTLPDGLHVHLVVGALAVDPRTLWLLREHADRLHVNVLGAEAAVPQWLEALEHGFEGVLT